MIRILAFIAVLTLPLCLSTDVFAAGGDSDSEPEQTQTTKDCLTCLLYTSDAADE